MRGASQRVTAAFLRLQELAAALSAVEARTPHFAAAAREHSSQAACTASQRTVVSSTFGGINVSARPRQPSAACPCTPLHARHVAVEAASRHDTRYDSNSKGSSFTIWI